MITGFQAKLAYASMIFPYSLLFTSLELHNYERLQTRIDLGLINVVIPEMRIWSILLIKSDLKWCIYLSRSIYLYYYKNYDFIIDWNSNL